MPTGYTADIEKGITFRKFALGCARAFGACVTMRDDSLDVEIPEKFEPSSYYPEQLQKAKDRLEEVKGMDEFLLESYANEEYEKNVNEIERSIERDLALLGKYQSMLSKVNAWVPPSDDHIALKKFMIEQIESSIKFDTMLDYYLKNPARRKTAQEWKDVQIDKCLRDIVYYTEEARKEKERVEGRTDWVRKLRDSLPDGEV